MKISFTIFVFTLAVPAVACVDAGFFAVPHPTAQLEVYDRYHDFKQCLDKLQRLGVNLNQVSMAIKARPEGNTANVVKWFLVQGQDGSGRILSLTIEQRIGRPRTGFFCGEPTDLIPRGC
jgi:hypothetical protein